MIKKIIKRVLNLLPLYARLALKYKASFKGKITYYRFAKLAYSKGVIPFRVDRLASEYTEAYYGVTGVSKEDKLWAIKRGLNPIKFAWYGLNKDNASDYLSDFDFYKPTTYCESTYLEFFENKLNTWLLLAPYKKYMPIHYWYIKDCNAILPLDIEKKTNGSIKDLLELIDRQPIAAKACYGGHGKGFYLLEKNREGYAVNRKYLPKEELVQLLKSLERYIFTEYCTPHSSIKEKIGENSFGVIRIITYYDTIDGAQLVSAMIRLGCKDAGIVTDYHGTIYCGLSLEDGSTFMPIYRESDMVYNHIACHPDTGVNLDGGIVVPKWDELKQLALQISRYLPFVPYLVIDVIPTEEGFSILEINSHGQMRNMEAQYPGLKNKYIRKHFVG